MILKGLKEKSNQKHINKLLLERNVMVDDSLINSIGVVLSESEYDDFEAFRELAAELSINPNKIKIAMFTEDDKSVESSRELLYGRKQIGWNAKIKNPELQRFIESDFDALICFYATETIELNLVAALSKAKFKIGLAGPDARLYDFIVETSTANFDVFKDELKKYLAILKKIA